MDHEHRVIRMEGKGRERRGGGSVTLAMESTVHELEGGRCEVTVVANIQLAGKIVRFGRGMIQVVTAQIFKKFTTCLAAELATGKPRGEEPAGSSSEALSLLPLLLPVPPIVAPAPPRTGVGGRSEPVPTPTGCSGCARA